MVGGRMLGLNKKALILAGGIGAVGLGVGALAKASVRRFADFDDKMNESLAIMGDVSEAMEVRMADSAREMGRTTVFSASQAAESYFFLASAGLDAEQSIAALPQVAAFAQAGMFDMARATDLATDAQSALGLTVDDAANNLENLKRVTDVLVKANTLANATVEQFSTALTSEAGAALKTVNKDIEEGVAVLAAYADQGVKAEKSGNALSRVIRMLTSQAARNADAYDRLGVSVFDSEDNLRNFADIVDDLTAALGDMSDQQRAVALEALGFRARLQGVILPLLGTGDAIREYEAELRGAQGVTQEIADKQLETLTKKVGILGDEFVDLGIVVGERLAPPVERGVDEAIRSIRVLRFELLETARDSGSVASRIAGAFDDMNEAAARLRRVGEPAVGSQEGPFPVGSFRESMEAEARRMRARMGRGLGFDRPELPESIRKEKEALEAMIKSMEDLAASAEEDMALSEALLRIKETDLSVRERLVRAQEEVNALLEQELTIVQRTGLINLQADLEESIRSINSAHIQRLLDENLSDVTLPPNLVGFGLPGIPDQDIKVPEIGDVSTFIPSERALRQKSDEARRRLKAEADAEAEETARSMAEAARAQRFLFEEVGTELIRGLAEGTLDAKEFLRNTIISLISRFVLGPMTGLLQIQSPSRVTASMGRNLVRGFEAGILEQARLGGIEDAWRRALGPVAMGGGISDEALTSIEGAFGAMSPARAPAAAAAAARTVGVGRVVLDVSGMPPARNPMAAARDREWQEFWRESAEAAFDAGFRAEA